MDRGRQTDRHRDGVKWPLIEQSVLAVPLPGLLAIKGACGLAGNATRSLPVMIPKCLVNLLFGGIS